ncbi:hypothetical protein GGR54DRAFT_515778 [Hypoxylon sp. NC1633]|nr:hypothetical protein GGR54DRAFT_515778 [Hypoxylon sp. NC1633]
MKMRDTTEEQGAMGKSLHFPVGEFTLKIYRMIWGHAAENAIDECKKSSQDLCRYWRIQNQPPYLKYVVGENSPVDNFPRNQLIALRQFFWPLLLVNKECNQAASKHLILMKQRREKPRLMIDFLDRTIYQRDLIQSLIVHSSLSNEDLVVRAGLEKAIRFPSILEDSYKEQLDQCSSVTNIVVSAKIFNTSPTCLALQDMLLKLPRLRSLLVDVCDVRRGTWDFYQIPGLSREVFEIAEDHDGEFRLKWEDQQPFIAAYQSAGDDIRKLFLRKPCSRKDLASSAWKDQKEWETKLKEGFLECRQKFIAKGIGCTLVCSLFY